MRRQLFYFVYRSGKYLYRILPIEKKVKQRLAGKVIAWLFKIYPRGGLTETRDACAYDIFKDRNASAVLQDMLFPEAAEEATRVMLVLVPFYNVMSGGIYSMFSIATHARRMKQIHGWEVLVMTLPNPSEITYLRNRHFINNVDVFRFSQILRLKRAKEIYIHLPEFAAASFLDEIQKEEMRFLESKGAVYVNILNQNIKLMPEADELLPLKQKFGKVGQSVAHHAYFGREFAQRYRLSSMLLPAYTDLSGYLPVPLERKEKLIIYSPDDAPYKSRCLSLIKSNFPDFELLEIRDITFDQFMDYASRCLFSITFGEGLDGYFAQPILQGGIGFAVYNDDFFPSPEFLECYNIFRDEAVMLEELPLRIAELLHNAELYRSLNARLQAMHDGLYSKEDYIRRIESLCLMEYEILYDDESGAVV